MGMKVHDNRGMVVVGLESEGRVCPKCERSLPWDAFAFDRRYREDGRRPYCRECDSARVLAAYHAKRASEPKVVRHCSECDRELAGRQRVVCSSSCRERRWRRLHPEAAAEKQRRKRARRREREAASG